MDAFGMRYLVDLLFLSAQITHICTGAQGCCEQTSLDYAGDENYIMRTVGEPERKNAFGLNLCFMQGALICVWLKLGICQPVNKAQSSTPYNESLRHGAHVGHAGSNFAQIFQIVLFSSIPVRKNKTKKTQWKNFFHTSKLVWIWLATISNLVTLIISCLVSDVRFARCQSGLVVSTHISARILTHWAVVLIRVTWVWIQLATFPDLVPPLISCDFLLSVPVNIGEKKIMFTNFMQFFSLPKCMMVLYFTSASHALCSLAHIQEKKKTGKLL